MSEFQGVALVASPNMNDPRFAQTVVLLLRHNEEGAQEDHVVEARRPQVVPQL